MLAHWPHATSEAFVGGQSGGYDDGALGPLGARLAGSRGGLGVLALCLAAAAYLAAQFVRARRGPRGRPPSRSRRRERERRHSGADGDERRHGDSGSDGFEPPAGTRAGRLHAV